MEKPLYKYHADEARAELLTAHESWFDGEDILTKHGIRVAQAEALVSIALAMIVVIQKLDVIIARQMGK